MTLTEDELARPLTAEEEVAIRRRHEAGQPLRAFDQHAERGTPADWAMARVFVEETTIDRARLLAALRATPVADTAGIDAAWREAEAALPEGWSLWSVDNRTKHGDGWDAVAGWDGARNPAEAKVEVGNGPTPAAALLALTAALRTPKPEGEPE